MKVCCPECGHVAPLTAFASEADARDCLAIALKMPGPLGDSVLRYLALFRPAKRALPWSRALKLIRPLAADIERGRIQRHGRDWAAPQDAWQSALQTVIGQRDSLSLPLRDHNYLYEIICRGANKTEAAAEEQHEQQRKRDGAERRAAQDEPSRASRRPPLTDGLRSQIDRAVATARSGTQTPQSKPEDNHE